MGFGVVYFIRSESIDAPVKIGWTTNLEERLRTLRTASAYPLTLIGNVGPCLRETETMIHHAFVEERAHGEWFVPSDRLERFIRAFLDWWPSDQITRTQGHWESYFHARARFALSCTELVPHQSYVERTLWSSDDYADTVAVMLSASRAALDQVMATAFEWSSRYPDSPTWESVDASVSQFSREFAVVSKRMMAEAKATVPAEPTA